MPLLFLIFLAVMLFFIIKFIAVVPAIVTAIVAIVVGGTTVTVLACVWLGTSYYLKRSGYHPHNAQQTYRHVASDLNQITADLTEVRLQLDDVVPYLRDMEFLKYARQNRKAGKKSHK